MIRSDTKFQHQEVQIDSCLSNTLFASKAEVEDVKNDLLNKLSDLREKFVASNCPIQTNQAQSSQLSLSVTPHNVSTQTERSSLNESIVFNKSNESLAPDESQARNKCSTREVIIAGDSLLDRIHIKRMKVNDTPSVKLTERGDNLRCSVARCINFVGKHNSENFDVVLLAGTNDLSNLSVSPDDLIVKLDSSLTKLMQFDDVKHIFLYKIPPRLDYHNINSKVSYFNQLLFERFNNTEEHISVVDTIPPEFRFYYQDGLHLSHAGLTKLCSIILSNLYRVLAPASYRKHKIFRSPRSKSQR